MDNVIFCYFNPQDRYNIFYSFRHNGLTVGHIAKYLNCKESVVQAIVRQEMRKTMGAER